MPPNTADLPSLANEPPAIGLSIDPSQTKTLVIFSTDLGDSLVQNVLCRHRSRHSSGGHFPDHGTKTAFELPNHIFWAHDLGPLTEWIGRTRS